MDLKGNFSADFFGDVYEERKVTEKPSNIADAIRYVRDVDFSMWDKMARSVFFKPGRDLQVDEVMEKILETNTVDGLEVPVGVYVDPAGEFQIYVYDDKENKYESVCSYCGKIIRAGDLKTSHGICSSCLESEIEKLPEDEDEDSDDSGYIEKNPYDPDDDEELISDIEKFYDKVEKNPPRRKEASSKTMYDFGDGKGPVPAHRHPNGGGWVANTAHVDNTAYVASESCVFNKASVLDKARIYNRARIFGEANVSDESRVFGGALVYGNARISNNSSVFGMAKVFGKAQISDRAMVYGKAQVFGSARVFGNARVSGRSHVFENAMVFDNASVIEDAQVFGNAKMFGNSSVVADGLVFGNAKISGNAVVSLRGKVSGSKHISRYEYLPDVIVPEEDDNEIDTDPA